MSATGWRKRIGLGICKKTLNWRKRKKISDFNGISACLGLFYAEVRELYSQYIHIYTICIVVKSSFFLCTFLWYQIFLSNTNSLHTLVWLQILLSNINDLYSII